MDDPEGRFSLGAKQWLPPFETSEAWYKKADVPVAGDQQALLVGSTQLFLGLYPPAIVPYRIAAKSFAPSTAGIELAVATGDTVVGRATAGDSGVMVIGATGSYVVGPQPGRTVSNVRVDRGGSESEMIWAESETTDPILPYLRPTLWSSPVANKLEDVVRTKIAVVDDKRGMGAARMVANRGVVLVPTSETTALLVRRSDGMGWPITTEPDTIIRGALWVDDTEVWLLTGRTGAPKDPNRAGILRIRRDTLGPATVPRGF